MNLGAFGKTNYPRMGAVASWSFGTPTGNSSEPATFELPNTRAPNTAAVMERVIDQTRAVPARDEVSSMDPTGAHIPYAMPGTSPAEAPLEDYVEDDFLFDSASVEDLTFINRYKTPLMVAGGLLVIGVLAYTSGIVGKATR